MKKQGLTLVEIIVAIAVFSIIMLALSGTIVSGLRLRRENTLESQALTYAASVLEQYKSFWADGKNFRCYDPDSPAGLTRVECQTVPVRTYWPNTPPIPSSFQNDPISIDVSCVDLSGAVIDKTTCKVDKFIPPLRRVSIILKDQQGKLRANLVTEIGNPNP
jgi:prepilin-type N-terminal cleavage/methylation domain-containing protein